MAEPATATVMEQIVALAKRRGFIYPASDIYGGIRGFWDYGPLGVLLKNNIRDHWWNWMVECPPYFAENRPADFDMVGLDSSIIQHPKTWEASGHVAGFNDPMVDDAAGGRHRADHMFGVFVSPDPSSVIFSEFTLEAFIKRNNSGDPLAVPIATLTASSLGEAVEEVCSKPKALVLRDDETFKNDRLISATRYKPEVPVGRALTWAWLDFKKAGRVFGVIAPLLDAKYREEDFQHIASPISGEAGKLTAPRAFNLMLDTYPGPIRDEANKAYLRPETAQGIFLNFKNIVDTSRVKVPFGVAQIGKSFRNEVTPRNFIFRSREFEQMEMEFFCPPDDALKWYAFWKEERMKWWLSLGVEPSRLRFRDHDADELSHYSKATVDIEYQYPFTAPDYGELEGIAHRGDYDLTQHQKHSGQKLDYFDQELQLRLKEQGVSAEDVKQRSRYIPNVIEPASGLTRAVLVLLCEAYTPDPSRPSGVYLKFKPQFAPIKLGIFPLVAKDGMPEKARALYMELRGKFACEFDVKQSIGKRYARMDEIGTPFCATIDGDTVGSDVVTIRHRDTQAQDKVNISQVGQYVQDRL